MTLETQPLLSSRNVKRFSKVGRPGTLASRLVLYCSVGFVSLIILHLALSSRFSFNREWNRMHEIHLSFKDIERILQHSIDPQRIRETTQQLSQEKRFAGDGNDLAVWTNKRFKSYGFKSKILTYDTYLSHPIDNSLAMMDDLNNVLFNANLSEDPMARDYPSLPSFHAYGASGNVTGSFLYANLGNEDDYNALTSHDIEIAGNIVIIRQDNILSTAGHKIQLAQKLGAIAVILYTDPVMDGELTPENGHNPFPEGPARNPSSIQGEVVSSPHVYPGDPTTPGWASKGDVERVDPYGVIPLIPSISMSYKEISPILRSLNGIGPGPQELGAGWKGALPDLLYNIGPSKNRTINLFTQQSYDINPIWDVVARIDGIYTDEAIIIGARRDTLTSAGGGAEDSSSGLACLLEIAGAFAELRSIGWKPLRTIIFAAWDGEEFGLVGSTEYAEDKEKFLSSKVLAYVNIDQLVTGTHFHAQGSPLLWRVMRHVVSKVPNFADDNSRLRDWNGEITNGGLGSDSLVFQQHLGIPSISFGFQRGPKDPIYHAHSQYDSFDWIDKFSDPRWHSHTTAVRVLGLLVVKLSETEVTYLRASEYAGLMINSLNEIDTFTQTAAASDDINNYFRNILLVQLRQAIDRFKEVSEDFDQYVEDLQSQYQSHLPWYRPHKKLELLLRIKSANYNLFRIEKQFLYSEGLVDRAWYRHVIFAPNSSGSTEIFPGLLQALNEGSLKDVIKWAGIVESCVDNATKLMS